MKEATGELNMTVVTLIAIAAIGAIFYFVVWPLIQRQLVNQTCRTTYGPDWHALAGTGTRDDGTQATVRIWFCCPSTVTTGPSEANGCHQATEAREPAQTQTQTTP